MQINTEFVQGSNMSIEFATTSNQLSYEFVVPKPFAIEFTQGSSIEVAFARPNSTLEYEFSIGKQGPIGVSGARGSLWTSSLTAPVALSGENNDIHLNYSNYDIYQKLADTWQLIGNIQGPQGPAGNGQGVLPVGGTTGQRLVKASAADFDTTWVDKVDVTYIHTEASPLATWNINHLLAKFPSVTVVDASGNMVETDFVYVDNNNITITFDVTGGFAGTAYLN